MGDNVPIRRETSTPAVQEGQVIQPWRDPASELFRDVDAIFSRMLRGLDMPGTSRWPQSFAPPVDIEETEDAYIFEFDLPGVRRDDITIDVGQQELHISGQIVEKERKGILRHKTRRTGSFDYRVALPSGIDSDRVQATFKDGVLTVTVPRAETSRPRRIKVD
ncbi:MAG TPA: heat-shock protein Hsp20 [Micromonosporaceae bacterium]|nr:heat-shock protein Hsp20 [Micromonosporaceae bacterium]HCU51101.1 heat-shock protein Hsp20 [Micromonosporaceae bacterium]